MCDSALYTLCFIYYFFKFLNTEFCFLSYILRKRPDSQKNFGVVELFQHGKHPSNYSLVKLALLMIISQWFDVVFLIFVKMCIQTHTNIFINVTFFKLLNRFTDFFLNVSCWGLTLSNALMSQGSFWWDRRDVKLVHRRSQGCSRCTCTPRAEEKKFMGKILQRKFVNAPQHTKCTRGLQAELGGIWRRK